LKPVLRDAPVFLDIGCSYGGFEYLLKKELPSSKHILVDMPGQLVLAFFYLKKEFPDSKIAFFEEVGNSKIINEDFIDSYDFVLIPTIFYDKLETKSIDVVFNFLSLSEMTEEWFNIYTQSLPYVSSKYIYLVNRYDSNPTYSNDITVYDYKLSDYEKMFMRTLPIIKHMYVVKYFFFVVKKRYPSEFFQFIGKNRRKDDPKKINTV